ncbi:MAG: ogr/Delta-like zinc finger family protein [Pseudomonadota bacterium]|nr:ogr/Delta-like zinc finger family protein [Pseudomonadota bacterium]
MADTNQAQITHGRHRNQFLCPHCKFPARVRTSRRISSLFMDGIVECQNEIEECGWRGRFFTEFVVTLTQSATPADDVSLPVSQLALPPIEDAIPKKVKPVLTKNPLDPNRDQMSLFEKSNQEK